MIKIAPHNSLYLIGDIHQRFDDLESTVHKLWTSPEKLISSRQKVWGYIF